MRPEPESTYQDSPSVKEVQTVEKEQIASKGHESPTLDNAGLERTRSIMDDDEVENDTEDRTLQEDAKDTSILDADDVVPQRTTRSSSISGWELAAESKEWENTSVQQQSCPTCQDGLQFTACEQQLVEQFQFVSACRHPRDFLTIFQDNADSFDGAEHAVAGFYHIPKECEYCGAASMKFCPDHCSRPKSFFQRKRPPFCSPGKAWDSKTDIEVLSLSDSKDKKVEVDVGRSPLRSLLLFGR